MPRIELDVAQIATLPRTHSETIPESYLDEMGHMNVRWYTHLFSSGSTGFMQLIDLGWKKIAEQHGGTFILESHTRFLSEVRVGQTVHTHARLVGRSAKRYHLLQLMLNEEKRDVAAVNEAIVAHIDLRNRRQAPMPEDASNKLDVFLAEHQKLSWDPPVCGVMQA